MTDHILLQKMAYKYYEVCKSLGSDDNPLRDFAWAEKALHHLRSPKQEWSWRWRSDEEDFSLVKDIYSEYETERILDEFKSA